MPDDRNNIDKYNRGGSKYDPRGGNGPTGSSSNSGNRNRYGDTKPYTGGKP